MSFVQKKEFIKCIKCRSTTKGDASPYKDSDFVQCSEQDCQIHLCKSCVNLDKNDEWFCKKCE